MNSPIVRVFCFQVLFLFSLQRSGQGQGCSGWMSPQYSTYASSSTDGVKLYSAVTVDGYTSGTCPLGCGCSGVRHTPEAYNRLGSTGGWGGGSSVAWNSYLSYTNSQSMGAQSILTPFVSAGEVRCSAVGAIFATALLTSYEATNPHCGTSPVIVSAPPQSVKCDGSTIHTASSALGGQINNITTITVTTSTDNVLLIDLIGGPTKGPVCDNTSGGASWCYQQSYKTAVPNSYTGKSGNIDWNYNIFCGLSGTPDIHGTVPQPITCQ
jgi:hypothetical protein